MDALTSVHLKNRPPSLSLCSLLSARNRTFLETWSCSKRAPSLNIWPSLNTEPTLSQISEETLESLKLRERNSRKNSERQTAPSKPPEGHPQSDVTRRGHAGFLQATQCHFNLKASIKQNLYKVAELVVFISKSKDNRVRRVKSCGNSKTVLYFNHSQLQQFIACVYVFCFMLFSLVHVL